MAYYRGGSPPDNVYINMSASAGSTSTLLSKDPDAFFMQKTNTSVVDDAGDYQFAVIRVDVNGARTLPLFIPSIASLTPLGTPNADPNLTNYAVALNFTMLSTAPSVQTYAATDSIGYLLLDCYELDGTPTWQTPQVVLVTATDAGVNTPSDLAALLQTIIQAFGVSVNMNLWSEMTVVADAVTGRLVFQTPRVNMGFSIDTGYGSPTSVGLTPVNPAAFGMPYVAGATPYPGTQIYPPGLWKMTSKNGVLITPNAALMSSQAPTFASLTLTATQSLVWTPAIGGLRPPPPPAANPGYTQTDSVYYWGFDYQHFVDMTNTALKGAWANIVQQVQTANKGAPPLTQCPYIAFNPSSKTFTLYADAWSSPAVGLPPLSSGHVNPLATETLQIGLNEMLQNLLMLPAGTTLSTGSTLNFNNSALVQTSRPAATPMGWAALSNDFSPTGSLWSPIGSLTFMTAHWPVRTEVSTTPTLYGADDFGSLQYTSTSYDSQQVLSDVIPNISDASDWRCQTTLYAPTVLRWNDMPARGMPIDTIDFRIGWRNARTGAITPLTMNPLASFCAKIRLRRKGVVD